METAINNIYQAMDFRPRIHMPVIIPKEFLDKILLPYRDHAKYLKTARLLNYYDPGVSGRVPKNETDLVTIEGTFSIPESCYIDDTGHFNAVEFNICYNQLAYVLFGKCIKIGVFHRLVKDWNEKVNLTFDSFIKHQLSSMFIVKIEGNFLKPLNSKNFYARLTINRIIWAGQTAFIYTTIAFSDAQGVKSEGPVMLAFRPVNGL
jgi:hypothetical protein